jgi:hypothetical protein
VSSAPRLGPNAAGLAALIVGIAALGCTEPRVIGEGQFSRSIPIASDPADPLPRLAWRPGAACPGEVGGCESYCEGPPDACPPSACLPLLIDSGTPLSVLPSSDGTMSFDQECFEVRAAGGVLDAPADPAVLARTTAAFRLRDAPMIRAPGDTVDGWAWEAGDERNPIGIGGVIGGNILRDFAITMRHLVGEPPSLAFYSNYPGSEAVLADQGRAYIRVQFPGRLLGRLLSDRCELGPGLDCRLSGLSLNQDNQNLLFEATRALVDACVAPPPCAVHWLDDACRLRTGGLDPQVCSSNDLGGNATLVVATGVPGLVLFEDSARQILGPLEQLPACGDEASIDVRACLEPELGRLVLPGWAPLEQLTRVRVRSLGLVEGLTQPSGPTPCKRLRARLAGLTQQCAAFAIEGRPARPVPGTGESVGNSVLVLGEVSLAGDREAANPDRWLDTLIVPATAAPVIALRREIVPEGAQPDGLVGGAMLTNTETILDFTESIAHPCVRVRCLDPGSRCMAVPACSAASGTLDLDGADPGRTSCCFGLPQELIAEVVLAGRYKPAPRVEDACCTALSRAAIGDLQSPALNLCTNIDLP